MYLPICSCPFCCNLLKEGVRLTGNCTVLRPEVYCCLRFHLCIHGWYCILHLHLSCFFNQKKNTCVREDVKESKQHLWFCSPSQPRSTCDWRNLLNLLQNWRYFKGTLSSLNLLLMNQRFFENFQPSQLSCVAVEKGRDAEGRTRLPPTCRPHWKHTQVPFRCFSTPETLRTQPALLVGDKISFIMNIKITIFILHFSPTQRGIFSLWKMLNPSKKRYKFLYIHTYTMSLYICYSVQPRHQQVTMAHAGLFC